MNLLLVILMPFVGFGCQPVGQALIRVVIYVGNVLINTTVGHTLEAILDSIFFPSKPRDGGVEGVGEKGEKAGDITIDPNDPKRAVYHGTMKLRSDKTGKEAIIQNPAVVRPSDALWTWTLDPRVKAEALKTLE